MNDFLKFQGIVVFLISPSFGAYLKAALGFRIGISPTEKGYGQKGNYGQQGTGVKAQLLSGVHGNPNHPHGGSGGWGQSGQNGNHGGGSIAGNFVRHLKVLGVNLYLGGHQKPHLGWKPSQGHGGPKQQIQLYKGYGHQQGHHHHQNNFGQQGQNYHSPQKSIEGQSHQEEVQNNFGGIDYSQNEINIDGPNIAGKEYSSSNLIGKVYSPKSIQQNQNNLIQTSASQV